MNKAKPSVQLPVKNVIPVVFCFIRWFIFTFSMIKVNSIFKKEIYATVSILGGSIYVLLSLLELPPVYQQFIPAALIIGIRLLVIKFKVSLPNIYKD